MEDDLHEVYGIDLTAPLTACGALEGRSWPWLRRRVLGLLRPGTRVHAAYAPAPVAPSDVRPPPPRSRFAR